MRAWRITKEKHRKTAFDGEGAKLSPGRWNHRGLPAVYVAATISLAALEYLVNTETDTAPESLLVIPVDLHTELSLQVLETTQLPHDWRHYPHPESTRDLGSNWLRALTTVALSVPSAVVPQERILVLNPRHAQFSELEIGAAEPFSFDPRLWRRSPLQR